jgi:hypothetical protein
MKNVQFTPLGGFRLRGAMSWWFSHPWSHVSQITDQKEKTEGAKGKLSSSHGKYRIGWGWSGRRRRRSPLPPGTTAVVQRGKEGGRWRSELAHGFRPHPSPSLPPHRSALSPDFELWDSAAKSGASTSNSSSPVPTSFPDLAPPIGGASHTHPRRGGPWWQEARGRTSAAASVYGERRPAG